jgi:hypothetical protein
MWLKKVFQKLDQRKIQRLMVMVTAIVEDIANWTRLSPKKNPKKEKKCKLPY